MFEAVGFINNMILSSHEQSSDVISYSNWRVCDTSQGSPKIAFVCLFADKDGIYIAVFIAFKLKRKCWIYERNAIAFFKQRLDVILSFFINVFSWENVEYFIFSELFQMKNFSIFFFFFFFLIAHSKSNLSIVTLDIIYLIATLNFTWVPTKVSCSHNHPLICKNVKV